MSRMFIDIHILQTIPPSNVNRDDTGAPKTSIYGGVRRARVSSQAWKKATRESFKEYLDATELGERTFYAVDRIAKSIIESRPDLADKAVSLAEEIFKVAKIKISPEKKKNNDETASPKSVTSYLLFLSRIQISNLAQLAIQAHDTGESFNRKTINKIIQSDNSIDIALFGRMITDSPDLNVDAACQVSHAFSVHPAEIEFDYFTASDDNKENDTSGAGMIGTVEFVAPTHYRYATINTEGLISNLDSVEAAARATEAFLRSFILSMPTGKMNTFANRTRPELVLVQIRQDQPVNLAESFEKAITTTTGRMAKATIELASSAKNADETYGSAAKESFYLATNNADTPETRAELDAIGTHVTFDDLISLVGKAVRSRAENNA
ncbi:CRISPR-associated Cse4 family protein [Corynebacterium kutscheri]|uniref:CRISPR-associated Cse4 family protein n=1 Tax=Corynebacterium kutscheri TaxID=35755 RepID=A0A0F6R1I5_9CORY|nr:type I-E CRISPR-associated protein Cas7/Cse4/CasC [Corynebacterium kutscheri]AKE41058.1 hypothetical protein UL82_04285 [Corynebacterium kutscheri]VEH06947.1 CRISPR-associated Cse4 family protein [Corynebacterium kutscheri]VEH09360.1 CRISPR-associated Cse4 family protein [Corynebacterium kutscheri]VEH79442.1 CRISPR-associated Cse4 family protein [Corynebacterium kutscheri]